MTSSGRACSAETADAAMSWGSDLKESGGLARKCSPPLLFKIIALNMILDGAEESSAES
jgi:hypothetical protein